MLTKQLPTQPVGCDDHMQPVGESSSPALLLTAVTGDFTPVSRARSAELLHLPPFRG